MRAQRILLLPLSLLLSTNAFAQLPPGNEKGVSMGHLHFRVKDPAVHQKLLVEALGAKVLRAGPLEIYQLPGVHLLLTRGTPSGGNDGTVINHLGFKVQDLDAVKAKLTAAGATVLGENPGTRQMFILFPDAIKIEFSEDKSLDKPVVHDHIHFAVPQIDEQRAWYEKTFGAKPGMTGRFKAADVPGVNLRWNPADRRLPGIKGTCVDHIGFEVVNLQEFCKQLEADGVKFDLPYRSVESLGLSIAFLTDPWGVYIELTEGLSALDKKANAETPP
jgi:catechol 2,3-dioxygenase-like lactoylglutathione lyase family enzyme